MKTIEEISKARSKIVECLTTPGLNSEQRATLAGMSVALSWVAGSPNGKTIERLLSGEPIIPGKDPAEGNATIGKLPKIAGRE